MPNEIVHSFAFILQEADVDKNGTLSLDEFKNVLKGSLCLRSKVGWDLILNALGCPGPCCIKKIVGIKAKSKSKIRIKPNPRIKPKSRCIKLGEIKPKLNSFKIGKKCYILRLSWQKGFILCPKGPFLVSTHLCLIFRHLCLILIHHKVRFDSWYLG